VTITGPGNWPDVCAGLPRSNRYYFSAAAAARAF
jgi:hypothetical protein